ncbi:hypothetical protein [Streptomyces sp. NRRL S-920]|uniref:hypothetical protein n=1 Tax=Streptomyces sp. NRRL S-920 TaxID=1463921 RepID=UPI000A72DAEB|nr:hypothetical protein [Streptomyces sp. NRRL S-920]
MYEEASRSSNEDVDHAADAARLARFLLSPRIDRIHSALAAARTAVARDTAETAPQVWHDNAETLQEAREAAGLDLHDAAGLGIKPATLQRFEQATGKLPRQPVSLGYLQLLTLTCTQAGRTAPACIPRAISQPVISLLITL